jgi:hypothetical protein
LIVSDDGNMMGIIVRACITSVLSGNGSLSAGAMRCTSGPKCARTWGLNASVAPVNPLQARNIPAVMPTIR